MTLPLVNTYAVLFQQTPKEKRTQELRAIEYILDNVETLSLG